MDTRLILKDQLKDIKKKANNRLKLLKRLASTSWGADKGTLRQLYMGYVRSIMDYTLALQYISRKTTRSSLDKVQNHAPRHVLSWPKLGLETKFHDPESFGGSGKREHINTQDSSFISIEIAKAFYIFKLLLAICSYVISPSSVHETIKGI